MDRHRLAIDRAGGRSARNHDRALEHRERAGERTVRVRKFDLEGLGRQVDAHLEPLAVGAEALAEQFLAAGAHHEVGSARVARGRRASDHRHQP